jgi:hypothetical protein
MHKFPGRNVYMPSSETSVVNGWLYLILVAMQTVGTFILYWNSLPWYWQLVADPSTYAPRDETWVWALSAITLIQSGYWVRHRVRPALPRFRNVLLGHFVLFLSRLSFLLATTLFSFVSLQHLTPKMPFARYILLLAGLFSLFCYMQELERLGQSLCGQKEEPDTPRA